MDKKKALRKLEELGATKYWELGEVIQILKEVVKEMSEPKLHSELSYGQAIEILKREGRPIKHESWSDAMIIPKNTGIGYTYFNGTYVTGMFVVTENMRDSGWIVLDR